MSTDAFYHVRGIEIDLAKDRWLYSEIISLHGHIKRDAPPVFTCKGNGEPMYVYHHASGRYFLKHFPGANCGRAHALSGTSDEHRRQAEYTMRAASASGLGARLEVATGGKTRVDVGITGGQVPCVGYEIQRSELSRAQAKRRCVQSFDSGWPTVWVHDKSEKRAPDWALHVPTARLVEMDWSTLPRPKTVGALIHQFALNRDYYTRRWFYTYEPKPVLLDELSYLVPAGEIIPVALGKRGHVTLAYRADAEVIDACDGEGAHIWRPTTKTPRSKEAAQSKEIKCHHEAQPEYVARLYNSIEPAAGTSYQRPIITTVSPQRRNGIHVDSDRARVLRAMRHAISGQAIRLDFVELGTHYADTFGGFASVATTLDGTLAEPHLTGFQGFYRYTPDVLRALAGCDWKEGSPLAMTS